MAAIYQADVWCDGCADCIKQRIAEETFKDIGRIGTPDGADFDEPFESVADLADYLEGMDERHYDSDDYPKYCSDDEESDCPQHCAGGEECVNADELSDGTKVGLFFGNSLTSEGDDYVREAVREDRADGDDSSVAVLLWAPCYSYIDFDDEDDDPDYGDGEESDPCLHHDD